MLLTYRSHCNHETLYFDPIAMNVATDLACLLHSCECVHGVALRLMHAIAREGLHAYGSFAWRARDMHA